MPALILSAMLLSQSYWDDPSPKGRWAAPTRQLAAELLPAEWAADAVSHRVGRPIVAGAQPFSVSFEGQARPTGDGFCARKGYYVSGFRAVGGGRIEPRSKAATDQIRFGDCAGTFARLNPGSDVAQAKRLLRWLAWAKHAARSAAPMPLVVSCRDDMPYDEDRCASGSRAALAALDDVSLINRAVPALPHRWKVAVPGGAKENGLYWDVEIDATPGASSVSLVWQTVPPF